MRFQRVLATGVGVVLVAAVSAAPSFGASAPSPSNTSAPRVRSPLPLPLVPVGPYAAADEAQPTVGPDSSSLSVGARALVGDRDADLITASDFSKYALGKLGYGYRVPKKYDDPVLTTLDSTTLTQAVNAVQSEVPTADQQTITKDTTTYSNPDGTTTSASPSATSTSSVCGPRYRVGAAVYNCSISTAHHLLRWAVSGPTALPSKNQADVDADGVPDFVETTADTLERAWVTYAALGYSPPSTVTVLVNGLLSGDGGLSLPGTFATGPGNIQLPADYDPRYVPAHELFHQFQYSYIRIRIPPLSPGLGSLRLAALTKAVLNLNWWMEATAEWATQKYAQSNPSWFTDPATAYRYAQNIPAFMEHPEYEIHHRDALAGYRQYGAVVLAEFLEERFDAAFLRRVWENVAGDFLPDSTSDLADTALEYKTNIGDVLSDFWASLYKVCDPNRSPWDGTLTLSDPDVSSWCTKYITQVSSLSSGAPGAGVYRLPHTVASVADTGSASLIVGAGGARVLDLTSSTSSVSRLVTVQAGTYPNAGYFSVRVAQWNRSPGDRCDTDQLVEAGAGATTFSFLTTPACPNATLIATNTGYGGIERTLDLTWTVQASSAIISNGVIQLGVNAAGQLNAPGTIPSSGTGVTTVGLRYLPTGADSIAPGCLCEGWGVKIVDSAGTVTAGSANESWGGARGLQVVSFSTSATEATSVVKVGDYLVTHHFHPSPDNRLYQVDVKVSGWWDPPTVTYRRVMDFDTEPTAFSEYMSIQVDAADAAQVLTTTNDGFSDPDPRTPASSRGASGSFVDYGPADQGALFDLRLPNMSTFASTATLYYGAGADAADASAALAAVGARTFALAKPSTSLPPTGAPNSFVFGYKPAS